MYRGRNFGEPGVATSVHPELISYYGAGSNGVRELILAAVGAVILITLGLATVNATESQRSWGDTPSASEELTASAAVRLAD
jgi:hypothetical protein